MSNPNENFEQMIKSWSGSELITLDDAKRYLDAVILNAKLTKEDFIIVGDFGLIYHGVQFDKKKVRYSQKTLKLLVNGEAFIRLRALGGYFYSACRPYPPYGEKDATYELIYGNCVVTRNEDFKESLSRTVTDEKGFRYLSFPYLYKMHHLIMTLTPEQEAYNKYLENHMEQYKKDMKKQEEEKSTSKPMAFRT